MGELMYDAAFLMFIFAVLQRTKKKRFNYWRYAYGIINVVLALLAVLDLLNNFSGDQSVLLIVRSLYAGIMTIYYVIDFTSKRR